MNEEIKTPEIGSHIQMMQFQCATYESCGSFPEITLTARVVFPALKGIERIDQDSLKRLLIKDVYICTELSDSSNKIED